MTSPRLLALAAAMLVATAAPGWGQAIVAIGDSITQGGNGHPSYRSPLIGMLSGANASGQVYDFSMVGNQDSTWGTPPNPANGVGNNLSAPTFNRHEGYWGLNTGEVYSLVDDGMDAFDWSANVALVHLGTNDALWGGSTYLTAFETNLNSLMDRLLNPSHVNRVQHVFLAEIIPVRDHNENWSDTANARILAINEIIRSWNTAAGVTVVDMHTGFINTNGAGNSMLYDPFHPNAAGEQFMAERWFNAMANEGVLSAIPEPSTYAAMLGGAALFVAFGRRVKRRRAQAAA